MDPAELKEFLDEKVEKYNHPSFVETDPIGIPKRFSGKNNIEISAILTATISWGNRQSIIKSAEQLMSLMDNEPYDFALHASENELNRLQNFVHRTFNGTDCIHFVRSLRNIMVNHNGLQSVFEKGYRSNNTVKSALEYFYQVFFETKGERTKKHVANVLQGSSAKRLNMFLRWMVRTDKTGVDFGLWKGIPASALMLPLDVHTGNVARKLNLLSRKQNDWKAVEEVTRSLSLLNPSDPVRYDFALFGLGIFENF